MGNPETYEQPESSIVFKDFLRICMARWYWFVISVVVCLAVGYYYILSSAPVYMRSADILMREDMKGSSADASVASLFSNMGMLKTNANIYDEVFAIKSPMLMEEVVRRLSLNVDYSARGRFKTVPRYGKNLPVEVVFPDGGSEYLGLTVVFRDGQTSLTDFTWFDGDEKQESDESVVFSLESPDTLLTPVGRVIVRGNPRFKGVIDDETDEEIMVSYVDVPTKAVALLEAVESEQPDEYASIIHLTLTDTSAERAEDIINTLIEAYNQSWVDDRNQVAVATSKFIDERLALLEAELGKVDADISTYKSENLIPDISAASNLYLSQASRMSNEILELGNQLQMARYISEYLRNPANSKALLPVNSGVGSVSLEQQISAYNHLLLERNNLADSSSESNPLVSSYNSRVAEMREAVLSAIDNQIALLEGSIENLRENEKKSTALIAANPSQATYLMSVERKQKVKESLYMYLLQKREENELGQTFTPYKTRIISDARGLKTPVSPKKGAILAVSFMIGLFIPGLLIFISESSDTTVRGRKDIEKLSLPFVGEIPQKEPEKKSVLSKFKPFRAKDVDYGIVVVHGGTDAVNEAFRIVRSNLEFMSTADSGNNKVIMVTSAIPASGKTFVSMNLAAVMALKGNKVLLVDLDMRRHAMSSTLGLDSRNGMSTCLAGSDTADKVLVRNVGGIEGLDILPAGAVPPNSSELLGGKALGSILP